MAVDGSETCFKVLKPLEYVYMLNIPYSCTNHRTSLNMFTVQYRSHACGSDSESVRDRSNEHLFIARVQ